MWLSPNGTFRTSSTVQALAPFLPATQQEGGASREQEAVSAGANTRRGLFVLLVSPSPQMVAGGSGGADGDGIAYVVFRISAEDTSFLGDLALLGWEKSPEPAPPGREPPLLAALGNAREFLCDTLARAAAETRRDAAWAELWRTEASETQRGDALATLKATACRVSIATYAPAHPRARQCVRDHASSPRDEDTAELLRLPFAWDAAAPWLCGALHPHAAVARSRSGRTNIVLRPASEGGTVRGAPSFGPSSRPLAVTPARRWGGPSGLSHSHRAAPAGRPRRVRGPGPCPGQGAAALGGQRAEGRDAKAGPPRNRRAGCLGCGALHVVVMVTSPLLLLRAACNKQPQPPGGRSLGARHVADLLLREELADRAVHVDRARLKVVAGAEGAVQGLAEAPGLHLEVLLRGWGWGG